MNEALLYAGSIIIIIWGIAHLLPTKAIVRGFGPISEDNKKIIMMESIAEGLALCFLGTLVLVVTLAGNTEDVVSKVVFRLSAAMLLAMALLTIMTGARTSLLPYKICPFIKTIAAILFILGSVL